MKKISVLATLLAVVIFAFTRCEKEESLSPKSYLINALSPELQELYKKMPTHNYGKIAVVGDGILQFESIEQYESVCDILQEECEMWNDLFYEKYGDMEEDELLDWEEKCGFDEFLPIVFFEVSLGVSGRMLYDQQKKVMQKWVDSEFTGVSPSDPIFIFESEQALHTVYHEVCIKDTIFQFRTDALVRCPLKELNVWEDVRTDATELLPADVIIIDKGPDVMESEPGKKYFVCRGYGDLNNADMSVIPMNDKSEYEVVGRRHINNKYTMKSKLTNYKYKKTNNNGGHKFQKVKRNCSIITTNQTFFTEQYHGIISPTYVGEASNDVTAALPGCKNKKSVTGTVDARLTIYDISYLNPWTFKCGVYQYPTLSVVIDGQRIDKNIVLY